MGFVPGGCSDKSRHSPGRQGAGSTVAASSNSATSRSIVCRTFDSPRAARTSARARWNFTPSGSSIWATTVSAAAAASAKARWVLFVASNGGIENHLVEVVGTELTARLIAFGSGARRLAVEDGGQVATLRLAPVNMLEEFRPKLALERYVGLEPDLFPQCPQARVGQMVRERVVAEFGANRQWIGRQG